MDLSDPLRSTTKSRLVSRLAGIQLLATALLAVPSFAQVPEVKSWHNATEGVRTQITITANAGITPAPVLLLECTQQEKRQPAIRIYLIPGPLKPHPRVGLLNSVSEWLLRIQLDDGQPVSLSWTPTKQPGNYAYEGEGENGMASEYRSPKKFLKDLLAAKEFDVEFQRQGERARHEANFDTSQLKNAFEARGECLIQ